MRARILIVAAGLVVSASVAQAQANSCPAGTGPADPNRIAQDACQMAVDVFQLVAPQLGVVITGGNATLGRGGTLGGLGHFSVGIRGNIISGDLPDVQDFPTPSINGAVTRSDANALPSSSQIVGLPAVDAAIGIYKGFPLAITNIGGIDALFSASYVPDIGGAGDDFQVKPKTNVKLGYGVRVGLLQESIITPGVSFTYLRRDLPKTTIIGTSPDVEVKVTDMQVKTGAWRVVASKSLLLFGIAIGAGQDRYDQSATAEGSVTSLPGPPARASLSQKITRTNLFADFSYNMPIIKLVGEIGQVSGGKLDVDPTNEFTGGSPTQSRVYGSLGLRIAF